MFNEIGQIFECLINIFSIFNVLHAAAFSPMKGTCRYIRDYCIIHREQKHENRRGKKMTPRIFFVIRNFSSNATLHAPRGGRCVKQKLRHKRRSERDQ